MSDFHLDSMPERPWAEKEGQGRGLHTPNITCSLLITGNSEVRTDVEVGILTRVRLSLFSSQAGQSR